MATKQEYNPLSFSNYKTEALDKVLHLLLEALDEYAKINALNAEQTLSFRQLLIETYLERRASLFVEHKASSLSEYINKAFQLALKRSFDHDDNGNITKVYYYNNRHKLVSNEQY